MESTTSVTYQDLYASGKEAYNEERWYECAAFMRRALEDYKMYRGLSLRCHRNCERLISTDPFPVDSPAFTSDKIVASKEKEKSGRVELLVPEARIFEKFVKKALCLRRCLHDRPSTRMYADFDPKVESAFQRLEPYSFMQICFWKLNDLEHAVSAAYTYLLRNPGDKLMSENFQFYVKQKGYSEKMLKDLEPMDYQENYLSGANAYDDKQYLNVIDRLERSIELYMEEYDNCRLLCDAPTDNVGSADIYSIIALYYKQVLKCRSDCVRRLATIRGNYLGDFVPSHFHYLQFAYWKAEKVRRAAEAAGTYLLFYPEDESMVYNKNYYKQQYHMNDSDFKPREEIVRYHKKVHLEMQLLQFINEKLNFGGEDYPPQHEDDYRDLSGDLPGWDDNSLFPDLEQKSAKQSLEPPPKSSESPVPAKKSKGDDDSLENVDEKKKSDPAVQENERPPNWDPPMDEIKKFEKAHGVKITKKERELNGGYRFSADKLLTKDQCRLLLDMGKQALLGDGYAGKPSPHTDHEEFRGLTIGAIAELVKSEKVSLDKAKLFMDKSELGRDLTQTYFKLDSYLYFDYTHLVCRTAKEDADNADGRLDLSHPIHGDNCVFKNGKCKKQSPAYTWRDYSAVIFLNDDFVGGEFIFSDNNSIIQAELQPKCGRMVAFSGDTLHGVKAVRKGTRCVLALWMTLDKSHEEKQRIQTQQLLAKIEMDAESRKSSAMNQRNTDSQ